MSMNNIFRRDSDDYQSIIEQFENNLPEPAFQNELSLIHEKPGDLQSESTIHVIVIYIC